ncbi:MAG: hypothetical protein JSW23_03960 [Planctomycetota bacterium]|nr:MAG: hypothetical protein JSW23_03960 [Planctomycetota bacterium]
MDYILSRVESFIVGMVLGPVPILFCFVSAWFTSTVLLEDENTVAVIALSGAGVGLIIDFLFLKRWVRGAYQINNKVLAAIYIFYSIGVFGFCMGIPILNFPVGMMAGIYTARKMYHIKAGAEECNRSIKRTCVFTALVMVLICCLLTLWAIAGQMIGYRLETPVLSFTLTAPVFFGVVLTGGSGLVLLQYWLTYKAAKLALRFWTA